MFSPRFGAPAVLALLLCWCNVAHGAPGDVLFEESFDDTADFTSDWSTSGSGQAVINSQVVNSASNSLRLGQSTITATTSSTIDTSGIDGADIDVWIRRGSDSFSEDPDSGEDLVFEYFSSGGSWTALATYAGSGTAGETLTPTFSLPSDGLHSGLLLRFRFLTGSGSGYDYWHIDDVVVTETGIQGYTCDTYADDFSSASYTNSTGTLDWSANSWSETNDDGSASAGLIEISGGQLELSGNNSLSNTAITRQLDTSTANQLSLDFGFQALGGIETVDSALVEISSNGGTSWTTLETLTGFSDGDSGSRSYDISAYAASNMQIRFAISPDDNSNSCCFGGGSERMEIDNLVIEACTVDVPVPIAEYRFEEASWSGTAGEVIDESGNGLNGQAINLGDLPTTDGTSPALSGDPGTCGYGEFDGTADGYVQINDPGTGSILDLSSELSVSVWIFPTAFPSGSNLHTIVSKDENFEFHLNSSGRVFWWWGGGSRSLTSTSSVTLNTWNHIAITYESGNQVIYINGVNSGSTNDSSGLTLNNDPLLIGTDLAFHSRRFNGFIDEVNIFDSTLAPVQVTYVMNNRHPCATSPVTHYAIFHNGTGVTCEAETVTITAHDSSDSGLDVGGNTIQITATSVTAGWTTADTTWTLAVGTGTFSTPSPGVAQYQFGGSETAVVLNYGNISEADIDFDVVDLGDPSLTDVEGSIEDPILSFADTGLRFYNDANADGDRDGTDPIASPLIAGITSGQFILRSVQTNSDTGACEARVTGPQTVNMGYQCVSPIYCFRAADADINGTPIGENDFGFTTNTNPVSLTFDADGEAPFNLEYYDAGAMRLFAELPLAASGGEPAITLSGTSASTVVQPHDLVITQVFDGANTNPGSAATGTGFITAGSTFSVVVQARNADGGLTPNFGGETINEGLTLVEQSLVMPSGGTLSALGGASVFYWTGVGGEFRNDSVSWPNAGTITMRAQIADGDYLGTGDILGTTSGNIGRFYPNHFDLALTAFNQGCASGGFTYMSDQSFTYRPVDVTGTIVAQGAGSISLSNYDSALGYPTDSFNAVAENGNDSTPLSTRAVVTPSTWVAGTYSLTGPDNAGFARALSGTNEVADGPYTSLALGLQVNTAGPDTVDFISTDLTMHPSQTNDCVSDGDCVAATLGTINARFGRLFGSDAHGPSTTALEVTLGTQYWNGTEFITNTTDSCTQIAAGDTLFDGNAISTDSNRTVSLSGGGTTIGGFTNLTPTVEFVTANGSADLLFTAPGASGSGSFNVDIDLSNTPQLRFDWDNDGDASDDTTLPSLEIYFGRYRGHDRVIYWQEVLN